MIWVCCLGTKERGTVPLHGHTKAKAPLSLTNSHNLPRFFLFVHWILITQCTKYKNGHTLCLCLQHRRSQPFQWISCRHVFLRAGLSHNCLFWEMREWTSKSKVSYWLNTFRSLYVYHDWLTSIGRWRGFVTRGPWRRWMRGCHIARNSAPSHSTQLWSGVHCGGLMA